MAFLGNIFAVAKASKALDAAARSVLSGSPWTVDLSISPINVELAKIESQGLIEWDLTEKEGQRVLLVDGVDCGTLNNPDVAKLSQKAAPAPFGMGAKTVIDEAVRKALQIDGNRIQFKRPTQDSERAHQSWRRRAKAEQQARTLRVGEEASQLFPSHLQVQLRAEIYKLHIYPPGGHFGPHVDTQHGPDHLISAAVTLGSAYTGGDFHLRNGDSVMVTQKREGTHLRGAAWFTDLEHWVDPVLTGTRVVLQFDVMKAPTESDEVDEAEYDLRRTLSTDDAPDMKFTSYESLVRAIQDHLRTTQGENVALLLNHRYVECSLDEAHLKGSDLQFYRALKNHFEVDLIPIFFGAETDYEGEFEEISAAKAEVEDIEPKRQQSNNDQSSARLFIGSFSKAELLVSENYIEFTGNEAHPGAYVYLAAAILVKPKKP